MEKEARLDLIRETHKRLQVENDLAMESDLNLLDEAQSAFKKVKLPDPDLERFED